MTLLRTWAASYAASFGRIDGARACAEVVKRHSMSPNVQPEAT
jgi:hypothetical protein